MRLHINIIVATIALLSFHALAQTATFLTGADAEKKYGEILKSGKQAQTEIAMLPDADLIEMGREAFPEVNRLRINTPKYLWNKVVEAVLVEGRDYTCELIRRLYVGGNGELSSGPMAGSNYYLERGIRFQRALLKPMFGGSPAISISVPEYACVRESDLK